MSRTAILITDGTNCHRETKFAIELGGGEAEFVHTNALRQAPSRLRQFDGVVLPGGFANGDDLGAGGLLALFCTTILKEEFLRFVEAGKPIFGICNGFQALVRMGLLPEGDFVRSAALMDNARAHFECRWVRLYVGRGSCEFTRGLDGLVLDLPVAHGEGRFVASKEVLDQLIIERRALFSYADEAGRPTERYPDNPNGSVYGVAGICKGRVCGMMPHPERAVEEYHHPNARRADAPFKKVLGVPHGLPIFQNFVRMTKEA